MSSFLIQSVTTADCESPTYGIISISVTKCNPINIFLPSVPISVHPFVRRTTTNFMPKDTLSYARLEGCNLIWQSFNASHNYYATSRW
jgi:hypothetical protein